MKVLIAIGSVRGSELNVLERVNTKHIYADTHARPGDTFSIDDETAENLIKSGAARMSEEAVTKKPATKKPAAKKPAAKKPAAKKPAAKKPDADADADADADDDDLDI